MARVFRDSGAVNETLRQYLWTFILGTALLGNGAVAFAQASGNGTTRVSLNWVDGSHGDVVVLSLTLDAPDGVSVGSLENEISFPTDLVAFVSAKVGVAGSATGAAIRTELTPDPTDVEKTILKMTLSPAPASGSAAEPLPDGVLADVSFQIAEDAAFEWITLGLKSKAWTLDTPARRVPSVVTAGGKIHVVAKGKFSCFFYMH